MNFFKSLYQSFKQALVENKDVQGLEKKWPRTSDFIKQRLDRTKFAGLPLTLFSLAFFYVLTLIFGAVGDFVTADVIVSVDARVNTLLYAFRNAAAVKAFIWITLLGESPNIIILALVISAILWLYKKKWQIVAFWLAIVGSEGLTVVVKWFFHRPRPITAIFLEDSNSFPSAHATIAVAFYGFLAYLLFRKAKKKLYRFLIVLLALIIMTAIGFSRLHLYVHYVSDVWVGYLVGLLWLIAGIGLSESKLFRQRFAAGENNLSYKNRKILSVGLFGVAIAFFVVFGLTYHPKFSPKLPLTVEAMINNTVNIFSDYKLPRFTETLFGETQEPISFIISAPDDALFTTGFIKAGWSIADSVSFDSAMELLRYAISNQQYSTAPMTPSFWNKQIHDFGFEKATDSNSVRQRHHARFWKTNLKTAAGDTIYVGTASLDIGIKWLVTHKISPDIDTERELLFTDLQAAGVLGSVNKIKIVSSLLGQNFSGDPFFTDGGAYFAEFINSR